MKLIVDIDRWEEILITITRNKTRSLLTAFGVFWGIFMLVFLIGGSNAIKAALGSNFEGFATNSCLVSDERTVEPYKGFRKGRRWSLENEDVVRLKREVEGIDLVTPVLGRWGRTAVYGEKTTTCAVKGLYPEYVGFEEQKMLYGRFINEVDIRENRKVCTIGKRIMEELFNSDENPCGEFIKMDGIYYQVIGVCDAGGEGINIGGRPDETMIMPFTTMQQTFNFGKRVDYLCVTAKEGYMARGLREEIERVVKAAHQISPTDPQAVYFMDMQAMFGMIDNLFKGINLLGWLVGIGTLLAGAIGVSNIMMVTVRERTTEIGIRRAIGARPANIMNQILSESMVLTSIAGFAGISFAVFILHLLEVGVNSGGEGSFVRFQVSFWLAVGTAVLLITLGMLAGLAPAFRAMAVKPIEAIRDE